MINITYLDFLHTITENDGEILVTSGGKAKFRLEKSAQRVCFTPLSSGGARSLNEKDVRRYLDIFNATRSTKTTDYTDRMQNASYVLAIIKLWIGQQPDAPLIDEVELIGNAESFGVEEGKVEYRSHRDRERSRELVVLAKHLFRLNHEGRLFCEVCDFDFGLKYGDPDFIEAHHRIPLRDLRPGTRTRVSDLAMVCANCHRMLHRGSLWPTVDELKQKIQALKRKRRIIVKSMETGDVRLGGADV